MTFNWTFPKKQNEVEILNKGDIVRDDNTNPEFIEICKIFSYRREHEQEGEKAFIKKYMQNPENPFTPILSKSGEVLAYRYDNTNARSDSNILWACHIDTVHSTKPDQIFQDVYIDSFGTAFVDEQQDCLGADDGTGVWLLLEMIKANCFGTYIFFRGEEQGCIGSSQLAEEQEDYFKSFTHIISLDRKGTDEVITNQRNDVCCSDKFADDFAKLLGMGFKKSDKGVYTDSAEFTHLIPECTNLGVGYINQHSSRETQDLNFLVKLRDKLISIDWANVKLSVERKPEPKMTYGGGLGSYYGDMYSGSYLDEDWDTPDDLYNYEDFAYMSESAIQEYVSKLTSKEIARLLKFMAEDIQYINEGGI